MCFNKEVSLLSFIVASAVVINLYIEKEKFLATILLLISLIQLNEYFIWKYFKSKTYNYYFTLMIAFIITLQIVISYTMSESELSPQQKERHHVVRKVMLVLMITFVILSGIFIYNVYKNNNKSSLTSIVSKESCRLLWGMHRTKNSIPISIIGTIAVVLYCVLLSYSLYITDNYDIMVVILGSLLMVFLYNLWYGISFSQNYGSVWCFMSNLLIVYVIIIRFENVNPSLINTDHGLFP